MYNIIFYWRHESNLIYQFKLTLISTAVCKCSQRPKLWLNISYISWNTWRFLFWEAICKRKHHSNWEKDYWNLTPASLLFSLEITIGSLTSAVCYMARVWVVMFTSSWLDWVIKSSALWIQWADGVQLTSHFVTNSGLLQ